MRRSGLYLLVPALLVGSLVAATVWRLVRVPDVGPVAPEVAVQHEELGSLRFEFEYRPGSETFEVARPPDGLVVRRGGDSFEYRHELVAVNGTMFPSPATGETVRWNLDGPLLIAGRPVAPHRFQPHPIDAPPAELLWQHKNPSDAPRDSLSADWSRVGRVLVTAHGDGVVRVWDVDKKAVRTEITPLAPTDGRKRWGLKAAVSPDGKTVAAANVQASAVTLWEADTGKPVATFDEPPGKVTHLRFASDRVLLEARGGGAYSRDLAGDRSKAVKHESVHAELAPAFAFAGGTLATNDGSVVTLKRPTLPGFPAPERGFHSDISGATTESQLAFSPDGRTLAIAGVWPLWPVKLAESGRASRSLWWRSLPDGRTASITALAFFADGRTLAVGGADGLRLYDVESGRERGWYPTLSIRSLAVSGDGEFLAAAMEHGPAVLLWRTADLQPR